MSREKKCGPETLPNSIFTQLSYTSKYHSQGPTLFLTSLYLSSPHTMMLLLLWHGVCHFTVHSLIFCCSVYHPSLRNYIDLFLCFNSPVVLISWCGHSTAHQNRNPLTEVNCSMSQKSDTALLEPVMTWLQPRTESWQSSPLWLEKKHTPSESLCLHILCFQTKSLFLVSLPPKDRKDTHNSNSQQ